MTGFRPEKPLTVIFHFIVINLRLGYTVIVRAKEKGRIPASRLRDCDYHVIDMYKITDTDEEGTCINIFSGYLGKDWMIPSFTLVIMI